MEEESLAVSHWESWVLATLLIERPSHHGGVGASLPDHLSLVAIRVAVGVEASSSLVSDVLVSTVEPSDSLESILGVEWSNNSCVAVGIPVVSVNLDRDSVAWSLSRSDGSGSPVEEEPLRKVLWVVVSDSQSVLGASDVLSTVESSLLTSRGLDLESESISEWVSVEGNSLGVNSPSLVVAVVAWVELDLSSVTVSSVPDVEAESSVVSEVSSLSLPEGDLLVDLSVVLSDDNWLSWGVLVALLVGNDVVLSLLRSDGSGSAVPGEPLSVVPWS